MAQAIKRVENETGPQTGAPEGQLVQFGPAARARAKAAELRKRAKLDRHRIAALNDGQEVAAPTKAQAKALKDADALEAKARAALIRPDRTPVMRQTALADLGRAYGMRHAVETERAKALAERQAAIRMAEAQTLDALREGDEPGSLVEKRRGQVQPRLRARDGLKLLHERGSFTPRDHDDAVRRDQAARQEAARLLAVGLRYRDRFELAASSLKSCLADTDRVQTQRDMYADARRAQRAAALNGKVREWEGMVSVALGSDALFALRAVAGEARSVSTLTTSSSRRALLTSKLRDALSLLGDRVARDA